MKNRKKMIALAMTGTLAFSLLAGCGAVSGQTSENTAASESSETIDGTETQASEDEQDSQSTQDSQNTQNSSGTVPAIQNGENSGSATETSATAAADSALETADLFTDRDLAQTADVSGADSYTVKDGETVTISEEGVYVFAGTAGNYSIIVDAADDAKVQIVLDGVSISNDSTPAIYVKNADKVFVTTTDSENTLAVTGTFTEDGDTNTDAVIFSKDDLVLNGVGTLKISSTDNGISGKDDVKVTGGTIEITCQSDGIEANDSIRIADGNITISTPKDGLHAENDEDESVGYIYIGGGTLNITAGDDAVHATTIIEIDAGTVGLQAAEGLEATWIQINGGDVNITASDDGINAGRKSSVYTPTAEFNGGNVTIDMGSGDTDAVDSNGNLIINGGTLTINAQSPFDYDGAVEKNGGTLIINGTETDSVSNQFGDGMGGMHGGMPGSGREGYSTGNQDGTEDGTQNDYSYGPQGGNGEGMPDGMPGGFGGGHGGFRGRGNSSGSEDGSGSFDGSDTDGTSGATPNLGQSGSGTNA